MGDSVGNDKMLEVIVRQRDRASAKAKAAEEKSAEVESGNLKIRGL